MLPRTTAMRRLLSARNTLHRACLHKGGHQRYASASPGLKTGSASHEERKIDPNSPFDNQGTATPLAVRTQLGLCGWSPAGVETLAIQKKRALYMLRSKPSPLEKYMFLAQIRNSNVRLFYKLVCDEFEEVAPIIYTPTVGEACVEYSHIYPFLGPPNARDGLFLTLQDLPHIKEIVRNYCRGDVPEIAVVSDGSRILGLGDLGVNGIGIPVGKLQLYVGAAGLDPRKTLPIILDFGTNNEKYLNDPLYLGLRQRRPADNEFYAAMDQVMGGLAEVFPDMLIQFEDFQSNRAFKLLETYQARSRCFNDDIQGTGAVILAGFINAFRLAQERGGVDPRQQRIVFLGAGSSAIGVAKQVQVYLMQEYDLSEQEAKNVFYFVDSKGLITHHRGDTLADHKVYYARTDHNTPQEPSRTLIEVLDLVRPTALVGLSAQSQAFNADVLSRMGAWNKAPIIFPLSNPMTNAECTFAQAMEATDARAIFASGTAFPPFQLPSTGETRVAGQGNNMYIFPGLGLGTLVARTPIVSDGMIFAAARGLSTTLTPEQIRRGDLYPSLSNIREVSAVVAVAVCRQALDEKLSREPALLRLHDSATSTADLDRRLLTYIQSRMWSPDEE